MKTCPYCAEQIQDEAKICHYCGRDLGKTPRSSYTLLTLIFFACMCGLAIMFLQGVFESPPDTSPSLAYLMCQDFVETRLKSPSTAQFASLKDAKIWTLGKGVYENAYRIRSYVDAQNAFGAEIRTHFKCDINYLGDDQWKLLDLEFGE